MGVHNAGPVQLTSEEWEHPEKVLDVFFKDFDLDDVLQYEKEVFEAALSQDDEDLGDLSRRDLFHYSKQIHRFWEAIYAVRQQGMMKGALQG
jgi:hypothetical protein